MARKRIKPRKSQVCIGSMRHRIVINVRTLTPPDGTGVDFDETLTEKKEVEAGLETKDGIEVFDGTNLKGVATHLFYIRAIEGQTAEDWVLFKDRYYNILDIQNFEEMDRFMVLRCTLRGDDAKAVNLA